MTIDHTRQPTDLEASAHDARLVLRTETVRRLRLVATTVAALLALALLLAGCEKAVMPDDGSSGSGGSGGSGGGSSQDPADADTARAVLEIVAIQEQAAKHVWDDIVKRRPDASLEEKVQLLADVLPSLSDQVAEARAVADTVEVVYESGMRGVMLFLPDGPVTRKGPGGGGIRAAERSTISGGFSSAEGIHFAQNTSEHIGNSDILICSPYEFEMTPIRSTLVPIINGASGFSDPFSVTTWTNPQGFRQATSNDCSVTNLLGMTRFGTIVFDTHGSRGSNIWTSELVPTGLNALLNSYTRLSLLRSGALITGTRRHGGRTHTMYAITDVFIRQLSGGFPNSLIFNASCQSTQTDALRNAFAAKGAGVYLGFDRNVFVNHALAMVNAFFRGMMTPETTAQQAFDAIPNRTGLLGATLQMFGKPGLRYVTEEEKDADEPGTVTAPASIIGKVLAYTVRESLTQCTVPPGTVVRFWFISNSSVRIIRSDGVRVDGMLDSWSYSRTGDRTGRLEMFSSGDRAVIDLYFISDTRGTIEIRAYEKSLANACGNPSGHGRGTFTIEGAPDGAGEPIVVFTLEDRCDDGNRIDYRFFEFDSSRRTMRVWGRSENWFTPGYGIEVTKRLSGATPGRLVCYGAKTGSDYWGVGYEGDESCEDCCLRVPTSGERSLSFNLVCNN